ncbi:hypothetical protein F2Q70_00019567 [Brassica cretica]|uniref:Uncharacterized protein n=1 Tax=Brassica cretica TaxID=69181 RepID=A0A8S9GTN6_BRACR|nr:hypothetical protein F2Q70_00019567 [Brassica cretica]KAF3588153.1 hypothetical protein F2Q69_00026034 [Brassica cretica]
MEDDDDPFSFFDELLEMEDEEDDTEHLVDELRINTGAFVDEALVEKLLENLDLEELEDEDDASFFDTFHLSSMSVVSRRKKGCRGESEKASDSVGGRSLCVFIYLILFDCEFVVIELKGEVVI